METIFNATNDVWKDGKYPLFLGQQPALYDSVNVTYPELFTLYKLQKSIDWSETEVNLEQSRMDMSTAPEGARELMIENLCYQWEADSIAARSIAACFAPFITNSEYWAAILKVSEIEVLHALTYSEIVRQCIPDPKEVFERIMNNHQLHSRMHTIAKCFAELKEAGAKYTLGLLSDEEAYPIVMNGLVALFSLERGQFQGSFGNTFAVIETTQQFQGIGELVAKIMQDERWVHAELGKVALKIELLTDRGAMWRVLHAETIQKIVDEVREAEYAFNRYLYSKPWKVSRLTESLANEYVDWNMKDVYDTLLLPHDITVQANPFPFMESWLRLDGRQNANQEKDQTNYVLNSVVRDVAEDYVFA